MPDTGRSGRPVDRRALRHRHHRGHRIDRAADRRADGRRGGCRSVRDVRVGDTARPLPRLRTAARSGVRADRVARAPTRPQRRRTPGGDRWVARRPRQRVGDRGEADRRQSGGGRRGRMCGVAVPSSSPERRRQAGGCPDRCRGGVPCVQPERLQRSGHQSLDVLHRRSGTGARAQVLHLATGVPMGRQNPDRAAADLVGAVHHRPRHRAGGGRGCGRDVGPPLRTTDGSLSRCR